MKRLITLILILSICCCLTGCGSKKANVNPVGKNQPENGDDSPIVVDEIDGADVTTLSPTGNGNNAVSDIDIDYSDNMTVETDPSNGMTYVESGNNRLYVEDVTNSFDPETDDPAAFLYDYAYEKCIAMVNEMFGNIETFNGEQVMDVQDNEVYGYCATMACDNNTQVYAYIKLLALENGQKYAVETGICDAASAETFDNVVLN